MTIIKGLFYTKEHEWVKVEGDKAYIGITDFAQHALGDIVFVELPGVDDTFSEGDVFATIESVKAASDIYLPVSGTIVEANEAVVDDTALINQDAFENWLVAVKMSNTGELDELMTAEQYEAFCGKEA